MSIDPETDYISINLDEIGQNLQNTKTSFRLTLIFQLATCLFFLRPGFPSNKNIERDSQSSEESLIFMNLHFHRLRRPSWGVFLLSFPQFFRLSENCV